MEPNHTMDPTTGEVAFCVRFPLRATLLTLTPILPTRLSQTYCLCTARRGDCGLPILDNPTACRIPQYHGTRYQVTKASRELPTPRTYQITVVQVGSIDCTDLRHEICTSFLGADLQDLSGLYAHVSCFRSSSTTVVPSRSIGTALSLV